MPDGEVLTIPCPHLSKSVSNSVLSEFSRQEHWSGLPFPSPGDPPDPEIEPGSPALQADPLPSEPPGKSPYYELIATATPSIPWVDPRYAHETRGCQRTVVLGQHDHEDNAPENMRSASPKKMEA